ncbi:MAG: hypothetical protein DRQ61_10020 [Gammaproteobacteria bacterium]|nr:MAG: hypothetical protein DRQ56_04615 [Gammaproteobacteria bacterium]RLA20407.1 MAG: hypothetical protein DRQ61_10020 [Gammaproteobacteria bacterium]
MNIIEIVVVTFVTLLVVYYLFVLLSGWRQRGRLISDITGTNLNHQPDWQVYYFYSPACGACRNMTPELEAQALKNSSVHCVDISVNIRLARQFKVRATPTAVLVEGEKISKVLLGSGLLKQVNQFISEHENDES